MWLLVLLGLASAFPQLEFHANYISRIVRTHEVPRITLDSPQCPKYACATSELKPEQCVQYDPLNNLYSAKACSQDKGKAFCPVALFSRSDSYCIEVQPSSGSSGLPGDACKNDEECDGIGKCVNYVCGGGKTGDFCDDLPDCDVGYSCHNLQQTASCEAQVSLGGKCGSYISNDYCVNSATCSNGVCEALFSKGPGAIVDTEHAALLCNTGFYKELVNLPEKAICIQAPKSPNIPQPVKCNAGEWCYSGDYNYAIPCECGYNPTGQGYCPLFPGDSKYQTFLESLKAYIQKADLNKCHILNVGLETCGASKEVYDTMLQSKREVDFYPFIQENDECIKSVYTFDYWFASE